MRTKKELTPEELEAAKDHMRAARRQYWDRLPEAERKERWRVANKKFWDSMTKEERRMKRLEYAAHAAMRKKKELTDNAEE